MESRIVPAGDARWLIELPERIDAAVNARAIAIAAAVEACVAARRHATSSSAIARSWCISIRCPIAQAVDRARGWTRSSRSRHPSNAVAGAVRSRCRSATAGSSARTSRTSRRSRTARPSEVIELHRGCRVSRVRGRLRARLRLHGAGRSADCRAAPHVAAAEGAGRIGCGRGGQTGIYPAETPGRLASDRPHAREAVRSARAPSRFCFIPAIACASVGSTKREYRADAAMG